MDNSKKLDDTGMSSDSDMDSSDDDQPDLEVGEEDLEQLLKLEANLKQNPRSYNQHVQYISLLEKNKLQNRLHAARRAMHDLFPMPEELWTSWLNDELEAVKEAEDVLSVLQLCEQSVKDYLSISLWKFLLQIMKDFDPAVQSGEEEGIAKFRQTCEDAVRVAGLHYEDGQQIWDVYRAWEAELLAKQPDDKAQQERVRKLFHRSVAVPLHGLQQVMDEYKSWETQQQQAVPLHVTKAFEKATEAAQLRQIYEKTVSGDKPADAELLSAYVSYIKLESESGDMARVQCLYERAICVFPTCASLWVQYLHFLESHAAALDMLFSVAHRATRNCHKSGRIWALYLSVLELTDADEDDHQAAYDGAIAAGVKTADELLDVILARAAYLRRSEADTQEVRSFFAAATQLLSTRQDATAAALKLAAAWAQWEAVVHEDVEAARQLWEAVVTGPSGRQVEAWQGYITLERRLSQPDRVRALYSRSLESKLDKSALVQLSQHWLEFEREEGSAQQQAVARVAAGAYLDEPTLTGEKTGETRTAVKKAAVPTKKKRKQQEATEESAPQLHEQVKSVGEAGDGQGHKRQRAADFPDENAPSKRTKVLEDAEPPAQQPTTPLKHLNNEREKDEDKAADKDAGVQDTDMTDAGPGGKKGKQAKVPPKVIYTDQQTVYVRNLGDAVTEDELRELFKDCGHIRDVRIPRDKEGVPKGFAYIELGSEEQVAAAEQLHGKEFKGQLLYVKKSDPPKAGPLLKGKGRGVPFKPGAGGYHPGEHHERHTGGPGPGRGEGSRAGQGRGEGGRHGQGRGEGGRHGQGRGEGGRHGQGRGEGGRHGQAAATFPTTRVSGATPKVHLQLSASAPFMPRSVQQPKGPAGKAKEGSAAGATPAAKTNADFRKMMFGDKSS